jgi:hypothetical protein
MHKLGFGWREAKNSPFLPLFLFAMRLHFWRGGILLSFQTLRLLGQTLIFGVPLTLTGWCYGRFRQFV